MSSNDKNPNLRQVKNLDNLDKNNPANNVEKENDGDFDLLFDTHTIDMPNLRGIINYKNKPVYDFCKRCFDIFAPEQLEEWKNEYKITNDLGVTKLGKFLGKTSLDKLPQLINIFNGSISICGYRPVVKDELLSKYNPQEQELLLKTKPRLTGFWTSHGRSDIPYNERKNGIILLL